jgi:hypothetical protein
MEDLIQLLYRINFNLSYRNVETAPHRPDAPFHFGDSWRSVPGKTGGISTSMCAAWGVFVFRLLQEV